MPGQRRTLFEIFAGSKYVQFLKLLLEAEMYSVAIVAGFSDLKCVKWLLSQRLSVSQVICGTGNLKIFSYFLENIKYHVSRSCWDQRCKMSLVAGATRVIQYLVMVLVKKDIYCIK